MALIDDLRGFVDGFAGLGPGLVLDGRESVEQQNSIPADVFFWTLHTGSLIPMGPAESPDVLELLSDDSFGRSNIPSQLFHGVVYVTLCRHNDPLTELMRFSAWCYSYDGVSKAREQGFTLASLSEVQDLSSLVSSYIERRAQIELRFLTRVQLAGQPLDETDRVVITGGDVDGLISLDLDENDKSPYSN